MSCLEVPGALQSEQQLAMLNSNHQRSPTTTSIQVLKYAAKMLSPTTVDLSPTVLQDMGIDGLSPQQAKLAAASVLARAVCPCEAAHIMAGRPLVVTSVAVTYVATHPPEWRRLRVTFRNGARQLGSGTPPLQQYINRPFGQEFDNLTLTQYFENYEVGCVPLQCGMLVTAAPACKSVKCNTD